MVRKDIKQFLKTIPENITLVAACKYVDAQDIHVLFDNGVHNIGENRVEDFLKKYDELSTLPITWHFIGHLQRNKAKYVANKIDFLHSLDSIQLAKKLSSLRNKPLKVFIEISINNEPTKNGVNLDQIETFLEELMPIPNIDIVGLMMMAKQNSTESQLESQFQSLVDLRNKLEKEFDIKLPYLSMGMSDDYKIAIKKGATHIRLGRILFE